MHISRKNKVPSVSVVIPVYNGEKTLNQCLNSILNQSFDDFEVILVDNDSRDKTKMIILDHCQRSDKIVYAFESIRSRGAARNKGEILAKGKIILMTDSDCILPKDWIEKIIKPIIESNFDAVQGSQEPAYVNYWTEQIEKRIHDKVKFQNIIGMIDTKNFAIKKDILKEIGYSDKRYKSGNDTEISIRLHKAKIKVSLVDVKVRHHHPDSLSKILVKYFYRAKWCRIITLNNIGYLKKTDFLRYTGQTSLKFFSFFPGIIIALFRNGIKWTFFEVITGMSWRAGLIFGEIMGK